jgi:hypothetical protein
MKNIHILSTDEQIKNVGDVVKDLYGDIHIFTKKNEGKEYVKTITKLNIYITSDEEIKEGDWVYCLRECFEPVLKQKVNPIGVNNDNVFKKIILTTDKDLIKDGVQAIDDEFLEWFVKNPSCENVEVVKGTFTVGEMSKLPLGTRNLKYKIIIPKEKTKQEALEEVAERIRKELVYAPVGIIPNFNDGFELGAKWQQGRSYSEEEVLPLLEMLQKCKEYFLLKTDLKSEERADAIVQVLENFKNK